MKKIRILSLDGGGIRGILPGTILSYLEDQIKNKTKNNKATIGQYFDFVAGTSTGGILSLVYVCPDSKGAYQYSAQEALDVYLKQGTEIFDVSWRKKIQSMGGVTDEKYEAKALEKALNEKFGETKLSQALRPCLITAYDIEKRQAHFFTSSDATEDIFDYRLKDVARATSAAPTYFEPIRVKSLKGTPHALIDGGVFANNPSLCAYAEARNTPFSTILDHSEKPDFPTAKEMMIVSIGTGTVEEEYPYDKFRNAGLVEWIKPLIDIMMSGNSETIDYQLQQIFNTLPKKHRGDYYRIQPELNNADNAMDNAEQENLTALHEDGLLAISANKSKLDEIVEKLIENH